MANILPKFKYEIGHRFNTFDRSMEIIDRKYNPQTAYKNGKPYTNNKKYYKYKCLKCGNEDWIYEYCLGDKMHTNCNACGKGAYKLIVGINDITTTAPWMVDYFQGGEEEASKYFKYSKDEIEMICPDCGRIHISTPHKVYSSHNLSCPCQDGWSYPNKFVYALLEQIGIDFETEKSFDWSNGRIYDDYIEYKDMKIITEQHGIQHYEREINSDSRTLEEEIENDKLKMNLAINNGITNYIVINSSYSTMDFMKDSIISSGLLELFAVKHSSVDWLKCHEFATSNFSKRVCEYKNSHSNQTIKEIAKIFKISYQSALRYIKNGSQIGWCSYEIFDDLKLRKERCDMITNQRPIHCITNGKYYRHSGIFVFEYEKEYGIKLNARNIRSVCEGKRNHVNNLNFEYITQGEFNNIKSTNPDLVYGEYFKLKSS